ncbi:unnamed protein product [Porites lobata]|uniref:Uncharacterized protein n=1 Tax=Porites lobata TaxID=104759 RepID=A0ABN8RAB3_9CNID|nr:unnamed protein product [Porites lobata]
MHEALKERPVKGTTAAVAILDESSKILEVQKIKQLSELHNFRYEESGIRVWKAYAVGVGRLIPWQSLHIRKPGLHTYIINGGKRILHQHRNKRPSSPKKVSSN